MMGAAPGDPRSAESNGIMFFPIIPNNEEQSWAELLAEGLTQFFEGVYRRAHADRLHREFDTALLETPPWKQAVQ